MKISKCKFDCYGICSAVVCYSSDDCSARDTNDKPIYGTELEIISHLKNVVKSQQQELTQKDAALEQAREGVENKQ